jgi:hypothetical protein
VKVASQIIHLGPRSLASGLSPYELTGPFFLDCPDVLRLPHLGCQCESKLLDLRQ